MLLTAAMVAALGLLGLPVTAQAADLQKLSGVRWVDHPDNDGDSFLVNAGGRQLRLRLYFVDCPETAASSKTDVNRIGEQANYFGLTHPVDVVAMGKDARAFVAGQLAAPFTVHTAFASAQGRSATGRVYAFVTTAHGKDLAVLLVQKGLARSFGMGRATPDGIEAGEMEQRLRDHETAAMLKREGIWGRSDPERIAELRAAQRLEDRKLKDLQDQINPQGQNQGLPAAKVDLNTASQSELEALPGIGPALAAKIIAGRPYAKVNDLARIKDIGDKKLAKLRPHVVVSAP